VEAKASEARAGGETLPDAPKRIVTPGNARGEKKRAEKMDPLTHANPGRIHPASAQKELPGGEAGEPDGPPPRENVEGRQARSVAPAIRRIGETYPPARFDPGAADQALKELAAREQWPGLRHIQADLAARLASEDWTREGGRFVPKLSRYLRERMWLMNLPGARGQPPPTGSRPAGADAESTENPAWRDDTVATDRAREVLEALKTGKRPEFLN
jgi:hypothetical protein